MSAPDLTPGQPSDTLETQDSVTFCWHLPIRLAYGSTGLLGVIGGVYLRCLSARGDRPLTGAPDAAELQRWAEDLAAAHGIEE